ncbi:hypothetical protein [Methyloversatilis discipulorum]|uniref:hypothetical protein n=1 Tax=Methyloversatilis discipulorum TaxID=1119528 RepID=UPI001A567D2E|nr:hypothetical protein [Methyloversatilis discipulorum]MBL8466455.1 hypothetical protein [Methyloversatilis discipulorum]
MTSFQPSHFPSLRRTSTMLATVAALALSSAAQATEYTFDILYSGNGIATLAADSDDPTGAMLFEGDSFVWTITIDNDRYWEVIESKAYFPLMAFATDDSGDRIGDFTLTLYMDSVEVFSASAIGESTAEVHVGTNSIDLEAGLTFDAMRLDYTLQAAFDISNPLLSVTTTLSGPLPIFGAPEMNTYAPGIVLAPVPEPDARLMAVAGLLMIGAATRRFKRR